MYANKYSTNKNQDHDLRKNFVGKVMVLRNEIKILYGSRLGTIFQSETHDLYRTGYKEV